MNHKLADTASCRKTPLFQFFTVLLFVFQCCQLSAQSAIDTRFLDANANTDGSIALANDLSRPYQSTAEAMITYEALGQSGATVADNGRTYLKSIAVDSTENLAVRLLTSTTHSPTFSATLADINQRQNSDGGVGAFVDFNSDLLSTTYALRVLSRARVVNEVSRQTVGYLLGKQNIYPKRLRFRC